MSTFFHILAYIVLGGAGLVTLGVILLVLALQGALDRGENPFQ